MIDGCGRRIDRVRLSLLDRCNLACRYCVPEKNAGACGSILDSDFAFHLVRWLVERHGIRFLRLTGGEPLLYPNLTDLVRRLSSIDGLEEVSLTTNGQALAAQVRHLADAGLTRVNISLDSLIPHEFCKMTRGGRIDHTLNGIRAAIDAGLTPVKINVVVQRGFNEEEIPDIGEWGLALGCVVRFLEVMPVGPMSHVVDRHLVPAAEIHERLSSYFELRPIPTVAGQPSEDHYATGRGLRGIIGIVAPTTKPFCARCRRIRVTSQGALVTCLHDTNRVDLSRHWDGRKFDRDSASASIEKAVRDKPAMGRGGQLVSMQSLGG